MPNVQCHYVYKIINLINNKEYIGVRSNSSPEADNYYGSSGILNNVIRIEGLHNFKKIILQKFDTREEAINYESELLTEEWCSSPNTYNIINNSNSANYKHAFRKDIWFDYYNAIHEEYKAGNTLHDIGLKYNCDKATIGKVVNDIRRTLSESQYLRFTKMQSGNRNKDFDDNISEIIDLYINQKKSLTYIAKLFKCDGGLISRRLIENGIILRTHKESQQMRGSFGRGKSKVWEKQDEICKKYLEGKASGLSMTKIAKEYGIDPMTCKNILIDARVYDGKRRLPKGPYGTISNITKNKIK